MEPHEYEIAGCPCGNIRPTWSEFKGRLWCQTCQRDFIPEHGGIFDGPVAVNTMRMLGIDLRQYDIATGKVVFDPYAKVDS